MLETPVGTKMGPPVQEPQLKRFLESIFHKKNIVGSFPLGYPLVSLYAIPQFWGDELILAICPDRLTIQKNVTVLKRQGIIFPDVAVLDGSQMPHEERDIYQKVRMGKVRLLYILPERLSSFLFIETLVRVPIRCLVIEQAQFLLEGFAGSFRYEKLWEGLNYLAKMPPLVLLTQPLPGFRLEDLRVRLSLMDAELVELPLANAKTFVSVYKCFTAHQKLLQLLELIQGRHRTAQPWARGSMLIQTQDRQSCEKLVKLLHQRQIQEVYAYHPGLTDEERDNVESIFSHQSQVIVVVYGYDSYFLKPPRQQWLQVVYWQLPGSLEESFAQFFRTAGEALEGIAGVILYTKEDYEQRVGRLKCHEWETTAPEVQQKRLKQLSALQAMRRWVLSMECRRLSLLRFWDEETDPQSLPCGQCDACQSPLFGGLLQRFLLRWFY